MTMSVAHLAPSALPTAFKRETYPSLRKPAQKPSSNPRPRRMSPAAFEGPNTSMADYRNATRPGSVGDSSDDELPEPMKFSALTRALLEEGASGVEGAAPALGTDAGDRQPAQLEGHQLGLSRRQSPPCDSTVGRNNSGSPPPRRVVRLSAGSVGSATVRKGSIVDTAHSPPRENRPSREVSPQDLITPAARPRSVHLRSSVAPPAHSGTLSNGRRPDFESSHHEANAAAAHGTASRPQNPEAHDSALRYGSTGLGRHKYGEESGLQSSIRVKRVGKVTGSFLSGPARRGRRRQSDEDHSPTHENMIPASHDHAEEGLREQSQEAASRSRAVSEGQDDPQDGTDGRRYREAPHVTFATGSPGANDEGDGQLRSRSPPVKSSNPQGPLSGSSRSAGVSVRPVFKVPPPPPSLPSRHDQENDPPPTFKRNKPSSSALQSVVESLSAHDEKPVVGVRMVTSPQRRALSSRSQNTPLRPAPPPPPPRMTVLETATANAGAAASSQSRKKRNHVAINGKVFQRVSCIGRGGSSRVYKVMAENDNFLAFKKVSFEDADEATVRGYKGEIDLLKKLYQVGRVINLIDWEINEEKRSLSMLMECGEIDFDKLLKSRLSSETVRFDISFARYYWKEMLECVQAVHDYGIVHTDLKPANFLLVKGHLKLIDFGIASAIQDDTVNIYREHLVGTSNFISPEAITDKNAKKGLPAAAATGGKVIKLGKPSDVWSLGCILYQMVYGKPPFAHITNQVHRIAVISNENHVVDFPRAAVGDVPVPSGLLRTLRGSITYDPDRRPTIAALLDPADPFLYPDADRDDVVQLGQDVLARILANVINHCRKEGVPADAELAAWPAAFFARIKKAQREEGF